MEEKPGLVLIHGAGLGSWIWEETGPLLESPWLPLDFPDRQRQAVPSDTSLETYSRHLLRRIQSWDQAKLILVAHSIGGVLALKLAGKLAGRVVGIVAVGAAIPVKGRSFLGCLPFSRRMLMRALMRVAGTKPPTSTIRKGLGSDLDLIQADRVVKRYVAESPRLYTDRCEAPVPDVESFYVRLGLDKAFPPGLQERMAANLRAKKIVTFASGHLPMISRPGEFAALINGLAAGMGRAALEARNEPIIASG